MMVVFLDPVRRTATCARAGHLPAIHYSATEGACCLIRPNGMALGVLENGRFHESLRQAEIHLAQDDWLLLLTDGVTEALDETDREFSMDRVMEMVGCAKKSSAKEMISNILAAVRSHAGSRGPSDDMTLVTVKSLC
jgi:sigma-B regulation protein RsbU (phosphoserine phosphatase)